MCLSGNSMYTHSDTPTYPERKTTEDSIDKLFDLVCMAYCTEGDGKRVHIDNQICTSDIIMKTLQSKEKVFILLGAHENPDLECKEYLYHKIITLLFKFMAKTPVLYSSIKYLFMAMLNEETGINAVIFSDACRYQNVGLVKMFIDKCPGVLQQSHFFPDYESYYMDEYGDTPTYPAEFCLFYAIVAKNTQLINIILSTGADPTDMESYLSLRTATRHFMDGVVPIENAIVRWKQNKFI